MLKFEAYLREHYQPGVVGTPLVHVHLEQHYLEIQQVHDLAAAAVAAGKCECHVLAWDHAPDAGKAFANIGIPVRLVRIPREARSYRSRRAPVFQEIGTLSAETVSHSNGKRDVHLLGFRPGLPISPHRGSRLNLSLGDPSGFDFIDYWTVDFDYERGGPFRHQWRCGRSSRDRRIPQSSSAMWSAQTDPTSVIAVKVVDVFGYETLTLLSRNTGK